MVVAGELTDRWRKSREMLVRAQDSLAGGVSSPFRAKTPVPLYFEDAKGCRVWDVDGNEYIDYALAWGPLILGHKHPAMVEALRRQTERPHIYGAQHKLEIDVAERIQQLVPCAERIAFTSTGSEAVQISWRLARACTNRNLIVKFEGHYHGWLDSVLISYHPAADACGDPQAPTPVLASKGQVPNVRENVVIAPWNDSDWLERLFAERGPEIAAVITEPVLCNSGCLMPKAGFLQSIRKLCTRNGSLLIFDEVITGFRMAVGGAQSQFGVIPDLATFGKAIAGGVVLSALAGRKDILDLMFGGGVAYGGTFNGNPISLAGAQATLEELSREDGAALKEANRLGESLQAALRQSAARHNVPLVITGFGTAFSLHFTKRRELVNYRDVLADDPERLSLFLKGALDAGIYLLPDGRIYVSTAHSQSDIDQTAEALNGVLAAL
jgi:glutamate-1-semialdehyde 2,1-aminomutase